MVRKLNSDQFETFLAEAKNQGINPELLKEVISQLPKECSDQELSELIENIQLERIERRFGKNVSTVFSILNKHRGITFSELKDKSGLSKNNLEKILALLEKENVLLPINR